MATIDYLPANRGVDSRKVFSLERKRDSDAGESTKDYFGRVLNKITKNGYFCGFESYEGRLACLIL